MKKKPKNKTTKGLMNPSKAAMLTSNWMWDILEG